MRYRASWLIVLLTLCGCSSTTDPSSNPVTPGPGEATKPYAVGAVAIVYVQSGSNDALVEAALIIDGEVMGPKQVFASGTFQILLNSTKYLSSKGSHSVSIQIVQQKYQSVEYLISGTAFGVNGQTGEQIRTDFPKTTQILKAGDKVTVSVSIP